MRIYFTSGRPWVLRPITVFSIKNRVVTEHGISGWQIGPLRVIFWSRTGK